MSIIDVVIIYLCFIVLWLTYRTEKMRKYWDKKEIEHEELVKKINRELAISLRHWD